MRDKELSVKKVFSSLDLAVIIGELKNKLLNSYVDNVYVDAVSSLILKLRDPLETHYLLIKPAERIHITKNISKLEAHGKITLFRKFLNNLKISNIRQLEFERIAVIELEGKGDLYNLCVELIPRGIIALTDSSNKVLVTSRELKLKDRQVVIGKTYVTPPIYKDFRTLDISSWVEALSKHDSLPRGLIRGLGVPPEVVNEVVSDEVKKSVSEEVIMEIRDRITRFIGKVIEKPEPALITSEDGEYLSFMAFRPSKLTGKLNVMLFESLNDAVDEYFMKLVTNELTSRSSKTLDDELSKSDRLLNELKREVSSLTDKLNELKLIHDLVTSNYSKLENVSNCVWNVIKKYGWDHVGICGISNYDRSKGIIKIRVDDTAIELNVREGVKNYLIMLKTQIGEYEDKIRKVKEVIEEVLKKRAALISERESLTSPPLTRRVDWYDKYHWIITSDGYLAIGGRDSAQNEKIVRKYLSDDDVFIHADIGGAPAFVLKSGGKKPSESSLLEVATLAACYSKGWKEGFGSLDVFWVYGSQVSKKPPAGEYLTPGSFMIYGEKNYLKKVKLELAIGVLVIDDEHYKLLVGPESYVSNRCAYYAVIVPGNEKKEVIARKLVNSFMKKDMRLRYIDINELILRIPGTSRVNKLSVTTSHKPSLT